MHGRAAGILKIFAALFFAAGCMSVQGAGVPDISGDAAGLAPACSDDLPTTCTGMTYVLLRGCSGFCAASAVYFECDGTGFTSYVCSQPVAPWTPWDPASTWVDGGASSDASTVIPDAAGG